MCMKSTHQVHSRSERNRNLFFRCVPRGLFSVITRANSTVHISHHLLSLTHICSSLLSLCSFSHSLTLSLPSPPSRVPPFSISDRTGIHFRSISVCPARTLHHQQAMGMSENHILHTPSTRIRMSAARKRSVL